MFLRRKKFIFSIIIFLILVIYQRGADFYLPNEKKDVLSEQVVEQQKPQGEREEATVTRVVDGDTIEVLLDGKKQKIRVIGINTPETVDPRRPVQCFGKEASNQAKAMLHGQQVSLESDPTQANQDNYGRLLRYVWLDKIDFGKQMIANGYAYEYTYEVPYKYQQEYKSTQKQARVENVGLWKNSSCPHGSS